MGTRLALLILAPALVIGGAAAALRPEPLRATHTVGHQARHLRLRHVEAEPEPRGPRVCDEADEKDDKGSSDAIPCVRATMRASFGPKPSGSAGENEGRALDLR